MAIGLCVVVVLILPSLLKRASASYMQILGSSMEPNFQADQVVRVEAVTLSDLVRGDVIVYKVGEETWIKRLIGLPGEDVEIRGDQLFVNGQIVDEPYDVVPLLGNCGPFTLGEDEYVVLGDNRPSSYDSCDFGPLPGDSIVQRVEP
jgi:signal peptidase I